MIPLVADVGFKRTRFAPAGGMRTLTVRDGIVRLLGKKGVMSPTNVTGAAKVSRALVEALHDRGVGDG